MVAKSEAFLLCLTVLVLSATVVLGYRGLGVDNPQDPEQRLQQCRQQCQQQQRGQEQRIQCQHRCEDRYQEEMRERGRPGQGGDDDPARRRLDDCRQRCGHQHPHDEQQRRQCESRCEAQYEEERRGRREVAVGVQTHEDPERRYRQCRQECTQRAQDKRQLQQCEHRCEEEYKEQRHREGNPRQKKEETTTGERNPYFFDRDSFYEQVRTEHGHVMVLENFLEKSELLLGIANYRIAMVGLNPRAFLVPHHLDADAIYYVARGCGVLTLVCEEKKETHELRRGDILEAPAGAIIYMINKDSNKEFLLIKLLHPVSTPGRFEVFYGAGGQNPKSFFPSFSDEILEAAFNTRRDRLSRIFGQQRKGGIVEASEEQVRALSRHASEGGQWPFGESKGPFNLLEKRPIHSSRRGQMHEADGDDYRPLKQLDLRVSHANLTEGSMVAPFYDSRSTKIAVILEGSGYVETICPHLSERGRSREEGGERREGREGGQRYQKVRSQVSRGTVAIIPPGHPSVTVASRGGNLEVVCFEIRAERNVRNFLAGRNNVLKQLDREAKELSFDMPAREVDEVLNAQGEQIIVAGPEERERRERPLLPMLEIAEAFM
ncbi:vicilin Cor a 11.0101-like [Musa acuminata AAA Group]|uniref:vicilin Cor a 11.0101-like n=1 Tax=Musa acuminata AAA Group TaxID=214697 RepID=UPI0031DDBCBD